MRIGKPVIIAATPHGPPNSYLYITVKTEDEKTISCTYEPCWSSNASNFLPSALMVLAGSQFLSATSLRCRKVSVVAPPFIAPVRVIVVVTVTASYDFFLFHIWRMFAGHTTLLVRIRNSMHPGSVICYSQQNGARDILFSRKRYLKRLWWKFLPIHQNPTGHRPPPLTVDLVLLSQAGDTERDSADQTDQSSAIQQSGSE